MLVISHHTIFIFRSSFDLLYLDFHSYNLQISFKIVTQKSEVMKKYGEFLMEVQFRFMNMF